MSKPGAPPVHLDPCIADNLGSVAAAAENRAGDVVALLDHDLRSACNGGGRAAAAAVDIGRAAAADVDDGSTCNARVSAAAEDVSVNGRAGQGHLRAAAYAA